MEIRKFFENGEGQQPPTPCFAWIRGESLDGHRWLLLPEVTISAGSLSKEEEEEEANFLLPAPHSEWDESKETE